MNAKLGPILTKTIVINFMTKIRLRLGMLVNTTPGYKKKLNLDFPVYYLLCVLEEVCTLRGLFLFTSFVC